MALARTDLIYPELCYKIIGVLFDVYNELGSGFQERYYQRAVSTAFRKCGVVFREQVSVPLEYKGSKVGRYYLDFLVEDKLVLELKKGEYFPRENIQQIYAYLRATQLKLGILANFTSSGIKFKRVLNLR